jgi:ArsR family transcriptional regulator
MTTIEMFELHAEFCKIVANPIRLQIIALLKTGELPVGKLAEATGSSLANISQHLRILRGHNVVRTRRDGRIIYYRLRDPRLVEACELTRSILVEGMKERGTLGRSSERAATRDNRRSAVTKAETPGSSRNPLSGI